MLDDDVVRPLGLVAGPEIELELLATGGEDCHLAGLVQVKSGNVSSRDIRDLVGTIDREKAQMGLFITLEEPTGPMRREALEAGFYHSEVMGRDYPRIQILTIQELFHQKEPQMPLLYSPYRLAERRNRDVTQYGLFDKPTSDAV